MSWLFASDFLRSLSPLVARSVAVVNLRRRHNSRRSTIRRRRRSPSRTRKLNHTSRREKNEPPAADTKEAFIADAKAIFAELAEHVRGITDDDAADEAAQKIRKMRPRFVGFQKRALTHGFLTPEDWAKAVGDGKEKPEVARLIEEYNKTNPEIGQKLELAIMSAMTGFDPKQPRVTFTEGEHIWTRYSGIATAVSRDGKLMATVGLDLTTIDPSVEPKDQPVMIAVWDTATGKKIHEWKDNHQSRSLAITGDGKSLVSVGRSKDKGEVRVWNLPDGKQRFTAELSEMSTRGDLTITADDTKAYLMSATEGYFAIDLAEGEVTNFLEGARGPAVVTPITGMVIRPSETQLEIFKSLDDFGGEKMPAAVVPSIPQAENISCSGNGQYVAATYNRKKEGEKETAMLAVYDLKLQKIVLNQPSGLSADPFAVQLFQVEIAYDGKYVVIFNSNIERKTLDIFEIAAQQRETIDTPDIAAIHGFTPAGILITSVSFRYQFFDPKTKSRIMPPIGAEHFHLTVPAEQN